MSQIINHTIPNSGGATYRAAVNAYLQALISASSGPAAPSPTVAGMSWFDTTTLTLKVRNNANTAWVTITPETIAANSLWGNPTGGAAALQLVSMTQLKTMLGYSQSLAANGYQVLPSGLILQWGTGSTTTSGVTVTFPIAFTAQARVALAANSSSAALVTYQSLGLTSVFVQGWTTAPAAANVGFSWLAMGY
jgi:hypothetical protein